MWTIMSSANRDRFGASQLECLFSLFLALLPLARPPVGTQIGAMRADILTPVLGGNHSVLHH